MRDHVCVTGQYKEITTEKYLKWKKINKAVVMYHV